MLTNLYPPLAYGGYEQSCRDVVRRWRGDGHEVLVLTSDLAVPDRSADLGQDRGQVRRDLRLYLDDHRQAVPPWWRRLGWERHNHRALARAVADLRPEVISAWGMGDMSLGLLTSVGEAGIPLVLVICDDWPVYGPGADAWTRLYAERPRLGRLVHALTGIPAGLPDLDGLGTSCFVSEAIRRRNRADSAWSFPDSVVVPSGIDPVDFPLAAGPDDRPWQWRLLHVGRLDPRKGLDTVLDALALCPNGAQLVLMGDGDPLYAEQLRHKVDRLGLDGRVTFDSCARSELAAHYRRADAVVFAPVWEEPFGLVPLEAMACATPVVASPTGGSGEFLADGVNCLTFPSGDAGALAAVLERLAEDGALRRRLVGEGLATAAEFDTDRLAAELALVHARAAGRSG